MLVRKDLLDFLAARRNASLITVVGPAASGKTTLVRDWLYREGRPAVWRFLDRSDSDPDAFLRRLDGALASVPPHGCVVVDNYQVIDSRQIHDALLDLLDRPDCGIHLVVISRSSIPFSLSRLHLQIEVAEVLPEDLRLSHHESERLLAEGFSARLSSGQVHEVSRVMEGWLGGLRLFGCTARDREMRTTFGACLEEACRKAEDYILDEVIGNQPRRVREFLYLTSLLGRFNTDLCEAIGFPEADEILHEVRQKNHFLLPVARRSGWYRYHRLFSAAVMRYGSGNVRVGPRRALTRAARWCAREGYIEEALRHAFASRNMGFAAGILEEYVDILYSRGEFSLFRKYFSRLPHDELVRHPLLWLQECRFRMESIQLAEIPLMVAEAGMRARLIDRYRGKQERLCRDLLQLFECLPDWYTPKTVDNQAFEEFVRRISPDNIALSGIVALSRPLSHLLQGQLRPAVEALGEEVARVFASGDLLAAMIWFRSVVTAERLQGHLSRCDSILNEAAVFIDRHGAEARQVEFVLYLPRAWVHYFRNEVPEALDYALAAVKKAEQTGFLYEIVDGSFLISLISMATGDVTRAGSSMRRMQKAAAATGSPGIVALTDAYLARFSVIHGDLEWAGQWAEKRRFGQNGDEPFSFRFVPECMAQSQLYYARGQYRQAAQLLETVRKRCKEHHMMEGLLEADLLYTGVLYALGDLATARAVMEEAAGFAQTEGYVRLFINRSPLISPVLVGMTGRSKRSARSPYLSVIAKACGVEVFPHGPRGSEQGGGSGLTCREVEILRFIAVGCRNKEIAEKAFISLDTVRTHTSHIFQKLDVKTRVQAIRKAEELGIIGSPSL